MCGAGAAVRSLRQASFFLPQNTSKGLFLQSTTTTYEVISILLTKFKIVTHPRKFALFEKNAADGCSCRPCLSSAHTRCAASRRLRRYEEPLVLVLLWGGANSALSLSLQVRARRGWQRPCAAGERGGDGVPVGGLLGAGAGKLSSHSGRGAAAARGAGPAAVRQQAHAPDPGPGRLHPGSAALRHPTRSSAAEDERARIAGLLDADK